MSDTLPSRRFKELEVLDLVPEMELKECFKSREGTDVQALDFLSDGRVVLVQFKKGKVKIIDLAKKEMETVFKTSFRVNGIAALQYCPSDMVLTGDEHREPKFLVNMTFYMFYFFQYFYFNVSVFRRYGYYDANCNRK